MTTLPPIIFETLPGEGGNIGLVTLSRPKSLNAMTHDMSLQLYDQLQHWAIVPTIKAVVIQAVPGRAFCAGGDIRNLYYAGKQGEIVKAREFFWVEYRLNHAVYHFPKPYIALMDGITMGGGVGISIHGSHRIATENFCFAMPEVGIGFFPDIGASHFLSHCPHQTGYYLGLTGHSINSTDAQYAGLIDHQVPSSELKIILDELVNTPFTNQPHQTVTALLQRHQTTHEPTSTLEAHKAAIENCFIPDSVENIIQRLENHTDDWHQAAYQTLLQRSPTSLEVTLQQLRKGAMMNLDNCLRMEYKLTHGFLTQHDFYEGIRAAIIDKDRQPRWQPNRLAEVHPATIDAYFNRQEEQTLEFAPDAKYQHSSLEEKITDPGS